ncbi:hypothetical protein ANCCAN_15115 [Ancylostoma caninum]|uniref:Uncharacterized protein n=1 Tax=Ancylostoma caninum TaxID=29170 RepID=A0A368G7K2_ANCCA|nr:hypothetical protein ANCCAN_15115 [Ancylostoma caninum]
MSTHGFFCRICRRCTRRSTITIRCEAESAEEVHNHQAGEFQIFTKRSENGGDDRLSHFSTFTVQ